MAQAKNGDSVKVHYTGRFDDGATFDSSREGDPLEFTLGQGTVIPGFEDAVRGMQPGESKTARIAPENAYGPRREEMVVELSRADLPPTVRPQVGQQLQFPQKEGGSMIVRVAEVTDTSIVIDANHPLAGRELIFEIELVEIA